MNTVLRTIVPLTRFVYSKTNLICQFFLTVCCWDIKYTDFVDFLCFLYRINSIWHIVQAGCWRWRIVRQPWSTCYHIAGFTLSYETNESKYKAFSTKATHRQGFIWRKMLNCLFLLIWTSRLLCSDQNQLNIQRPLAILYQQESTTG